MRATESAAIESGTITGLALMERAGAEVLAAACEVWPHLAAPGFAVILCGPGNNGGDGFVIARLLRQRGWAVSLFLYGDPERLPPDARSNFERWSAMGETRALEEPGGGVLAAFATQPPDLIVDALFGTGLTRDLPDDVDQALMDISEWRHRHHLFPPVVAVDVPSGLCADSGRNRGCVLACDLTVTFHRAKPGHFLAEGPEWCGMLRVADIGLPPERRVHSRRPPPDIVHLVTASGAAPWVLKQGGHKYDHGHALILSGGVGKGGAARLAARAALRIGAGLVTLGVPPAALQENAARLDAVMLRAVPDASALSASLEDRRITALCLGPGLGLGRAEAMVGAAVSGMAAGRGLVLDADALTAFADAPEALFSTLTPRCVLTPHGGEFRALFPDLAQQLHDAPVNGLAFSKVDAVRLAAHRAGCVVLLKGPDTVIADPSGRCAIHAAAYDRAAPWLATAGAGDVLAGLITGLMARKVPPFEAACSAAWLHVEAALAFGPGLIAEDLADRLPAVFRALESSTPHQDGAATE